MTKIRSYTSITGCDLHQHQFSSHQVCGEEGPLDRAVRAVTHTVGHNSVATIDGSRESVPEPQGNAQTEYPLRGILALQGCLLPTSPNLVADQLTPENGTLFAGLAIKS